MSSRDGDVEAQATMEEGRLRLAVWRWRQEVGGGGGDGGGGEEVEVEAERMKIEDEDESRFFPQAERMEGWRGRGSFGPTTGSLSGIFCQIMPHEGNEAFTFLFLFCFLFPFAFHICLTVVQQQYKWLVCTYVAVGCQYRQYYISTSTTFCYSE